VEYVASIVALGLIYGMVATADNLTVGYSGQFTIAQGAFFGIGAYAYALGTKEGLSILVAMLLGVAAAAAVGAALAFVARDLRGDYFMIVTLAFQIIAVRAAINLRDLTGGTGGVFGIEPFSILGYSPLDFVDWLWVLVPMFAVFWIVYTLIASTRLGLIWKAIREDDLAAMSLGRSIVRYKMAALALSAAGSSIAGGLYAGFILFISPSPFTFAFSIFIISVLIVGGLGNPLGPVLGTALLMALPEALRFLPAIPDDVRARLLQVIYAAALLLFVALRPQGIAPERPGRWSLEARRWRRKAGRQLESSTKAPEAPQAGTA
jgi:branched-chain amino acid transport system permease protein